MIPVIFIAKSSRYRFMIILRNLYRNIRIPRQMDPSFDISQFSYSQSKKVKNTESFKSTQSNEEKPSNKKSKRKLIYEDNVVVFNKILEWRKNNEAPVDTMGCHKQADPHAPIQLQKYHWLVSLMLSIQTKDQTTSMIMTRLKEKGLTPENVVKYSEQKLKQMIYESNFNKRKAANILTVSRTILEKGKIADNLQDLIAYPGVGVKIAMLYLKIAEGKLDQGIGVDTHVHRISNRLGWVKSETPQQTEKQLRQVFPVKVWPDINECLVGFGQLRCNAKKPECSGCPVEDNCPSKKYSW